MSFGKVSNFPISGGKIYQLLFSPSKVFFTFSLHKVHLETFRLNMFIYMNIYLRKKGTKWLYFNQIPPLSLMRLKRRVLKKMHIANDLNYALTLVGNCIWFQEFNLTAKYDTSVFVPLRNIYVEIILHFDLYSNLTLVLFCSFFNLFMFNFVYSSTWETPPWNYIYIFFMHSMNPSLSIFLYYKGLITCWFQ